MLKDNNKLLCITLCVGCFNGMSRALIAGDINIVVLIAMVISLRMVWRADALPLCRINIVISLSALIGFCIPSAMISWAVLWCYIMWHLLQSKDNARIRAALIIMAAIAMREPIIMLLLKFFSVSVLSMDTLFVQHIVSLLGENSTRSDNLITMASGRTILILSGCSSVSNLSLILLGWLAYARMSCPAWQRADMIALGSLVIMVIAMNWTRLTMLTLSSDAYLMLHSEWGFQIYQLLLLALAMWIVRRVYART